MSTDKRVGDEKIWLSGLFW